MEPYALLIIFVAMVAIWWWSWAPWKKRPGDELSQGSHDDNEETNGDRRR